MEAFGNAWYGSWRPLTNLTQTYRACHLCTFNVAAIFFRAIHTYGVTTVCHDNYRTPWYEHAVIGYVHVRSMNNSTSPFLLISLSRTFLCFSIVWYSFCERSSPISKVPFSLDLFRVLLAFFLPFLFELCFPVFWGPWPCENKSKGSTGGGEGRVWVGKTGKERKGRKNWVSQWKYMTINALMALLNMPYFFKCMLPVNSCCPWIVAALE